MYLISRKKEQVPFSLSIENIAYARVTSPALTQENSKNETIDHKRQKTENEGKQRVFNMERNNSCMKLTQGLTTGSCDTALATQPCDTAPATQLDPATQLLRHSSCDTAPTTLLLRHCSYDTVQDR